jgi:glutaredoxin-like protein NrdH
MIKVYALSTCGHCRRARRLLDELGAKYTAVEVDRLGGAERSLALSEMRQFNPALSFPTILIGEKVIVGNRESLIREALEEK